MKISVILPAHNEADNLKLLIPEIQKNIDCEIIVINDNSTDNTTKVLSGFDVICINRIGPKGVGRNYREGIALATGEIIVFMDADFSHNPDAIPKIIEPIISSRADMVQGSRFMDGGTSQMSTFRKIVSGCYNAFVKILLGIKLSDYTSGFRAVKKTVIDTINLECNEFDVYVEIPIKVCLKGYRVVEVPIHYYPRRFGKSNLNYFKMGPKYLWAVIKIAMSM
jgi:dolichol-phosphate mannosyltransferase